MMKKLPPLLFLILIGSFVSLLRAQQTDLSSLYRYNWQILNPAAINYTYLEDKQKKNIANAAYRQQWMGLEGAPASYNARFEYFPDDNSIKVGGFIMGDQSGAISTNSLYGNFAYLIYFNKTSSESYLSLGLNLGVVQYRVRMGELRFQETQSNLIAEGVTNQAYADMALGCFYRWKRMDFRLKPSVFSEFYVGVSVPQTFGLDLAKPQNGAFDLQRIQHYYALAGGLFSLSREFVLEPSLWVRYVPESTFQTLFANAPISSDLNVRAKFYDKFWVGSGFSTNKLMHFEAGFQLGKGKYLNDCADQLFTLGIAYDAPMGWGNQLPGSIEISLGIGWR